MNILLRYKHKNDIHIMHVLDKFKHCPCCGSSEFVINDYKSKRCTSCGFIYYLNPSSAVAAFILNTNNELLVVVRKNDPKKNTFDLPGGFVDIDETIELALSREIKEETNLTLTSSHLLFTLPNHYKYSGFDVPTLDTFFIVQVKNDKELKAGDDAKDVIWIPIDKIDYRQFGLYSIRKAICKFIEFKNKKKKQKGTVK